MLRDRIVVGMKDVALSERLQMDSKLTLEKVKRELRQKEAVQQHQHELQGEANSRRATETIEPVDQRQRHPCKGKGRGGNTSRNQNKGGTPNSAERCRRCGKARHPSGIKCPAATATCHRCHGKGHYKSQCFSRNVASTDQLEVEESFLGVVSDGTAAPWTVSILVGDKTIPFKIDTGAQVTAISDRTFGQFDGVKLKKPSKSLYGPAQHLLDVTGQFTANLRYGQKCVKQRIFVVKDLQANLLGLPALTALKLLYRVDTVAESKGKDDIIKRFPKVFSGLGNIGEEYTIQLKPNATPYSLFTPRNVALPLREKV